MKKITYISNIAINESSGGGSGINFATVQELKKSFDVSYCGPINPANDLISKIFSKVKRKVGLQGNYHFFSEKRLFEIKQAVERNCNSYNTDYYFFHGFTPWIKTELVKPYFCFNDACFATYVEIYNNKKEFSSRDLKRIYDQEAQWLKGAEKVFFRSRWALQETRRHYSLRGDNWEVAGVGGFIDIPAQDNYEKGNNFLFISREFLPKGGLTAVKALQILRKKYPEAKLWIVGDKPEQDVLNQGGVVYKGFFRKNNLKEKEELQKIFNNSFALIHPTIKDTNTLVITELAYYGCPAISTNDFAIPEYLIEGETGFLVQDPRNEMELSERMLTLIENPKLYHQMRFQARENSMKNNTWEKVGQRITSSIMNNL